MTGNLIFDQSRQLLISLLFLLSIGNTSVYGFERGPLIKAALEPSAPNYYTATPLSGCTHAINATRGIAGNPVPGPNDADLLNVWITNWPTSGPINTYFCNAKIFRFAPFNMIMEIIQANGVHLVCNIGDSVGGVSNETICIIPDTTPDKGANAGQPQLGSCAGNPFNTATVNKDAKETKITTSSGLSF